MSTMPAGTDGQWTGEWIGKCDPGVNCGQEAQVVRTEVSYGSALAVARICGEAMRKIRHCAPCKFAGLFDATLPQGGQQQFFRLGRFMIIMAGKNDGGNGGPSCGALCVLVYNAVAAHALEDRCRPTAFALHLASIQLLRQMPQMRFAAVRRKNHHPANQGVGMLIAN